MTHEFLQQWWRLTRHGLRVECAEPQRWLSSLLFAITILFLFSFAMGDIPSELKLQIVLSELFLCCFLVLQLVHQRVLATEEEDRAVDILVASPISYAALYLAKLSLAVVLCCAIILPFLGFMQILHGFGLFNLGLLAIAGLVILALSALGILLAQMTQKATGRDLLFPLLYFPLSVPVLLAAVQASFCYSQISSAGAFDLWLGLLGGFCIIYLTLGILLFEELVGLD